MTITKSIGIAALLFSSAQAAQAMQVTALSQAFMNYTRAADYNVTTGNYVVGAILDGNYSGTDAPKEWSTLGDIAFGPASIEPPAHNAVPEPATWAMLIAGFGLVGSIARRRTPARFAA